MTSNLYLDLTREFNEGRLRCILSSGQAVVVHQLAVMSKDGDWIVREDDEALTYVLQVLEKHGATYRLGAPLDTRWMAGGWSAHFEFGANGYRARTDLVSRPPRLTSEDLAQMWVENERGESGLPVPTIDVRRLIELKKTDRERDYAIIGELARLASPEEQLLVGRSARDLIEIAGNRPELLSNAFALRPALSAISEGLDALELALFHERQELVKRNRERLAAYSLAAQDWVKGWPALEREMRSLSLLKAHEVMIQRAMETLPFSA